MSLVVVLCIVRRLWLKGLMAHPTLRIFVVLEQKLNLNTVLTYFGGLKVIIQGVYKRSISHTTFDKHYDTHTCIMLRHTEHIRTSAI